MKIIIKLFVFILLFFPALLIAQKKSVIKKTVPSSTASVKRGMTVYQMRCLACHQADGSGVPNLNPPLIRTAWVKGSKEVLIHQVLKGSKGQVVIDGDHFNNTMPPIPSLSDEEIADVLTYVRNSFKNKYSSVSLAEVQSARKKITK